MIEETLRSAHYTLDDLLEQLRGKDVYQIADVEYAILETNGDLSVKMCIRDRPITAIGGSKNGLLRFLSFSARVKLIAYACARCNFGRTCRPKLRI